MNVLRHPIAKDKANAATQAHSRVKKLRTELRQLQDAERNDTPPDPSGPIGRLVESLTGSRSQRKRMAEIEEELPEAVEAAQAADAELMEALEEAAEAIAQDLTGRSIELQEELDKHLQAAAAAIERARQMKRDKEAYRLGQDWVWRICRTRDLENPQLPSPHDAIHHLPPRKLDELQKMAASTRLPETRRALRPTWTVLRG